ncbi:MAG TPA: UDP-N-acetylmuramoyl-L-alanine--D-glutamate ligase [Terriglobia bacterium]|nr:UDP-N-acetylmuramoyl-L-alanine--D-glutamate ligase [Terriglobia bacterium]
MGMARSGIAAARLLHERGKSVFVTDSGDAPLRGELDSLGIPYETGGHTPERFLSAEEIVMSPGVPLDIPPLVPARRKGVPIVSEIEIAFRYLQGDIVAITGSNGKTTTTTLVGEVLHSTGRPVQVGGNIGNAMSSLVNSSAPGTINVVEVSSFQLDGIRKFRPNVAVLLNITPDHLDRYADFNAYRAAKFRVLENQQSSDTAVLNRDDEQVYPPPAAAKARMLSFSQRRPVEDGAYRAGSTLYLNGKPVMPVAEVSLRGAHNIDNILATMTVADCYGVSAEAMSSTIRNFRGVEHRIEFVAEINGVKFFNDSKATNVDSAIKAVESFDSGIILILGGKDKGGSYLPLVDAMTASAGNAARVKHVLLIGAASDKIAAAIGNRLPMTRAATMADAVKRSMEIGKPGDIVLLSPACASFDMYDNYEHRGRVFKESVLSWPRS